MLVKNNRKQISNKRTDFRHTILDYTNVKKCDTINDIVRVQRI